MSDLFFNISGLALGVVGLLGTVQVFYAALKYCLPKHRAKRLEEVYATTYSLLRCGVEEGLLTHYQARRMEDRLLWTRAELNDVQARVVCLGGLWRQICAICGSDISNKLRDIENALGELRLDVASSSQKGRSQLAARGRQYLPQIFPFSSKSLYHLGSQDEKTIQSCFQTPLHSPLIPPNPTQELHVGLERHVSRSLKHRDSMSSVSTTTTAVDSINPSLAHDKAAELAAPVYIKPGLFNIPDLGHNAELNQAKFVTHVASATAENNSCNNVQQLVDVLLSQIHYVSQLRRQLEVQGSTLPQDSRDNCDTSVTLAPSSPDATILNMWPRSPDPALLPV